MAVLTGEIRKLSRKADGAIAAFIAEPTIGAASAAGVVAHYLPRPRMDEAPKSAPASRTR